MINGGTVLAVIPARGGSKRCPRKNIRLFRGQPLIVWTLYEAMLSRYIDRVCVSTEDDEIAKIADQFMTARPKKFTILRRPLELATDEATNEDVLRHALAQFRFDWVVLLQPTSPLRSVADIDACITQAQQHGHAVVSYRPDGAKNGAVYVASRAWIAAHDFTDSHLHYEMPNERSLDIDYPADFDH